MSPNKIEVDLDKLELEIAQDDAKITAIQRERELKVQVKEYILSTYRISSGQAMQKLGNSIKPILAGLAQIKATGEVGKRNGISDFVRDYVAKHAGCHTTEVGQAYAKSLGKDYDNSFAKMVSRCLDRLRSKGELFNQVKEGGKRGGSFWYTKKAMMESIK